MPDVFEVLGTAHREVERMLEQMQVLMAGPAAQLRERGGSLADTLISAVSGHETAEEEYFWPAVRDQLPEGDALAAGGIEQEAEAKKVLAELDGMAPGDGRFVALMTKFAHAARAHIAYEEQQTWPGLRAALTAAESAELGGKLARAAQDGPTRPHPHTPSSPVVLKAAGPAVAAADKIRDAVSGRDN